MLGHSVGEYVAAHLAGVMTLEGALFVVATRGQLMQALPTGTMAAVHCPAEQVSRWLAEGVSIAGVNAPNLCTVSGPAAAVDELLKRLVLNAIEARVLHTSHAFHSAMMEPILAPFTAVMEGIALSTPQIPYVSNVTGAWITAQQATSPSYYATHLRCPVQFEAGVRTLAADPATLFLEVGPGNTLTSLARLTLNKERAREVFPSLPHPLESRPESESVFEAAARLWLAGAELDWTGLHADSSPRRIPLPTYPFERERYWVEPAAAALTEAAASNRSSDVKDWLLAPTWMRDDSCPNALGSLPGVWLVLAEAGALADAVLGQLKKAGADPILVEGGDAFQVIDRAHVRVRPGREQDISAFAQEVRNGRGPICGALSLWSASSTGSTPLLSYHALVALIKGLDISPDRRECRVIVGTFGAESVLDEPVRDPAAALALGPVLGLPFEVPGLMMRAVDFDAPPRAGEPVGSVASALIEEAANADGEILVARRAGRRWVRRFENLPLPAADPAKLPLKPRGVYLITGGLGGIGITLARWLAGCTSARLLLTARTPVPPREKWNQWLIGHRPDDRTAAIIRDLKEIEQAGGEVLTAVANAADLNAMSRAVEGARAKWGEIDGVIHAAGTPGTGRIVFLKGSEEVQAVLSPKVDGLTVLMDLLGDTPLDFVALMSSINAVFGAPGVCDYAAANAVLDAFADSAGRPPAWHHVVSFDWAAWREVGMAARLVVPEAQRAAWQAHLQGGIAPSAGTEVFRRVLASGRRRVVVSPYDLIHARDKARKPDGAPSTAVIQPEEATLASTVPLRPELSSAYEPPATEVERRLADIWTELLGVERIGVRDDFFELGGHSLLGTRLMSRVYDKFGVRLALRDVFDAPTIHRLADRLRAASTTSAGSTPPAQDDREELVF
jgi:acyl transferase domain-containing protein